ncbi:PcfJ domain-containing protein [Eubacterium oxidoreducens]|uniref:PcfJ-like protein n=1 Tax=Eubacterium oxidoreducens TaxID=1732 RepID=A0A1G6B275_EUBOX|nr:PcfJ domain-containing protein [Eubacterium oxidoreducens]SDB14787.1 PcfJ-like protein [Eubacterium oxidoreducens]
MEYYMTIASKEKDGAIRLSVYVNENYDWREEKQSLWKIHRKTLLYAKKDSFYTVTDGKKSVRGLEWIVFGQVLGSRHLLDGICKWQGSLRATLMSYSRKIKEKEARERWQKRVKKSEDFFKPLPKVLNGFLEFCETDGTQPYVVEENGKCFCTACKQTFPLITAKHKEVIKCPSCKREVVFRKERYAHSSLVERGTTMLVQPFRGDIAVRIFDVRKGLSDYHNKAVVLERVRGVFANGRDEYFENKRGYFQKVNRVLYRSAERSRVYQRCRALDAPTLKLAGLPNFKEGYIWEVTAHFERAVQPAYEKLYKAGFETLCKEIRHCRHNIDVGSTLSPKKLLKITGEQFKGLNRKSLTTNEIKALQENPHLTHEDEKKLAKAGYKSFDVCKYITCHKAVKFAKGKEDVLTEYVDFLRLAKEIGEKNLFPKDVLKAHDDAFSKAKAVRNERLSEKIREVNEKRDWSYEKDDLKLELPKSFDDFVKESDTLKHCVGRSDFYAKKVAKEEIAIVFVRKEGKPHVTAELSLPSLDFVQIRGLQNSRPSDEVKTFLNDFRIMQKMQCA